MKKPRTFLRPTALFIAVFGALSATLGSAYAITWPETPAGEIDGGRIGQMLHPDSTFEKIGIGTYNPQGRLNVVGKSGVLELTGASSNGTGVDCEVGEEKVPVDTSSLEVDFLLEGERIVTIGDGFVCLLTNSMEWAENDQKEWKDPTTDVVIDAEGRLGIKTLTPQQALDVAGAINLGNTTSNTTGAIRFNQSVSDFEGYTGAQWKSLTEGTGTGSGGVCVEANADDGSGGFANDTITASCSLGKVTYSTVEWEDNPGIYKNYFGIEGTPANDSASVNCLGQGCKLHLICCEGGAGGGSGGNPSVVMPQAYGIEQMDCNAISLAPENSNPLGNHCATVEFSGVDIASDDLTGGISLFTHSYTAESDGQLRIMANIPIRYGNAQWDKFIDGSCEKVSWQWKDEDAQRSLCKNNWEHAIMATIWVDGEMIAVGDIINPEQLSAYSDGGTGTILGVENVIAGETYDIEVKLVSFGNRQVVDKMGWAGTIKTIDHEVEGYVEFTEYVLGGEGGDTLPDLDCNDGEIMEWDDGSAEWVCAVNTGGASLWGQNGADIYYNAGKVGIGTMTPNKSLHIKTPAAGENAEIDIQSGDLNHWGIYHDKTTEDLRFWNDDGDTAGGSDNILTITNEGNVGIGTTDPRALMELYKDDATRNGSVSFFPEVPSSGDFPGEIVFDGGDDSVFALTNKGASSGKMFLSSYDGMDRKDNLVITNEGNVGIGTTAPNAKLDVRGKVEILVNNNDSQIRFHDPGDAHYAMGIDVSDGRKFKIGYGDTVGVNDTFVMNINTGDVGIGTANPESRLDVAGKIRSDSTANDDPGNTVVTKDYIDARILTPTNVTLNNAVLTAHHRGCDPSNSLSTATELMACNAACNRVCTDACNGVVDLGVGACNGGNTDYTFRGGIMVETSNAEWGNTSLCSCWY